MMVSFTGKANLMASELPETITDKFNHIKLYQLKHTSCHRQETISQLSSGDGHQLPDKSHFI
jgi:hypothetical protein